MAPGSRTGNTVGTLTTKGAESACLPRVKLALMCRVNICQHSTDIKAKASQQDVCILASLLLPPALSWVNNGFAKCVPRYVFPHFNTFFHPLPTPVAFTRRFVIKIRCGILGTAMWTWHKVPMEHVNGNLKMAKSRANGDGKMLSAVSCKRFVYNDIHDFS